MDVELITFETKCVDFMRFSSIFINLLEIFRILSFVFDLKYLSQNSINFNMLGVFWNPQDEQNPKLSLDLCFEQHLKEILRVLHCCRCWLPPLYLHKSLYYESKKVPDSINNSGENCHIWKRRPP